MNQQTRKKSILLRLLAMLAALAVIISTAWAEEEETFTEEAAGEEGLVEEEWVELEDPEDIYGQWAHDVFYHTPNERSPYVCNHEHCFWKLNMGELNEEAIWQVLTAPVTVLKGNERHQVKVRARPEKDCEDYTGVVTCASQCVHILEQDEDWTLIEAYSSCQEGSKIAVFALPFQGYVETKLLEQKEVDQQYGIVIDKLQQRLYVFKEGKLFAVLLCSTGFPKDESTLFRETPAGEFLMISWVGGFWAEKLYCDMGIRINDGILIHEVPRIWKEDTQKWEYRRCEQYLGDKASHGCIRVQKEKTPEGVNAKWLWDNLSRNPCTKVIIWDEIDRELMYPDDDLVLYYNPGGGENYHSQPTCRLVLEKYEPMQPFLYSQLDEKPFSKLGRCPGCSPQLRREEIDTMNAKNTRKGN